MTVQVARIASKGVLEGFGYLREESQVDVLGALLGEIDRLKALVDVREVSVTVVNARGEARTCSVPISG